MYFVETSAILLRALTGLTYIHPSICWQHQSKGRTPVNATAMYKYLDPTELLLNAKANVEAPDENGVDLSQGGAEVVNKRDGDGRIQVSKVE